MGFRSTAFDGGIRESTASNVYSTFSLSHCIELECEADNWNSLPFDDDSDLDG
mgnify:FL=1